MNTERELDLLGEYMSVYIQLLPYSLGESKRLSKHQLPTFQYFKDTYESEAYSLSIPHYKDSYLFSWFVDKVVDTSKGLGAKSDLSRPFNYWMGCKFFTGKNINGLYKLEGYDH